MHLLVSPQLQGLLGTPPAAHLGSGAGLWIILCAVLLAGARADRLAAPRLALLLHWQPHQHRCLLLHLIPAAVEKAWLANWRYTQTLGAGGDEDSEAQLPPHWKGFVQALKGSPAACQHHHQAPWHRDCSHAPFVGTCPARNFCH